MRARGQGRIGGRLAECLTACIMGLPLLLSALPAAAAGDGVVSLPQDRITVPDDGSMSGVVVIVSDANGWDMVEQAALETVVLGGAVAVGVDLRTWRAALSRETARDCLFLPADIERLTRQLHRSHEADFYRPPRILGFGEGGALALAIAAQTPNGSFAETIGETVAVDPTAAIALPKPLCTPAPRRETPRGTAYGLAPGKLPNPVRIAFSSIAGEDARQHAASLHASHPDVLIANGDGGPARVLSAEASELVARLKPDDVALDLPLVEDIVTPTRDTVAIFYSGDGGWREIDQRISARLNENGIPVIGVDALRYFWSEKTPEVTAADLSAIIAHYRKRLGVSRVVLIGYSFGANILPKVHGLLPAADQEAVTLLSLLALSHQADFEIVLGSWVGVAGTAKHGDPVDHLATIDAASVQCVYGLEEEDSGCPALGGRVKDGLELVARPGGHHFDENYELIADRILARITSP
ncbi:virulence factor family protein [Rhizobium sp. CRIBSB]|nr:virulence factor family protein [Rhizobium sp. CRIBSB]